MRLAVLLLLAGAAVAAPKHPHCVKNSEEAVKIARTRGKLIFLTVIVDNDAENRLVIDNVFRDRAFIKISKEFVCVYANPEDTHGKVKFKNKKSGKRELRCADCPSIVCLDHMLIAQNWSRAFFPGSEARTPIHFVIDANEDKVATIMNGSFEAGFNHVPASKVVAELKKMLKKYGKGLTEQEYAAMVRHLSDAKAARARDKPELELEHLLEVLKVDKKIEGVAEARKRIQEIDAWAAKKLKDVEPLVAKQDWIAALGALDKLAKTYHGTLTAAAAEKQHKDLLKKPEVKKLLKGQQLYAKGIEYRTKGKLELAKKKFAECIRKAPGTKFADLAQKELDALK
ncbi:MAG: hypothetical protein ACYTGN_05400 [Planctomycetota bacterium]|jgi:hypothetical protein